MGIPKAKRALSAALAGLAVVALFLGACEKKSSKSGSGSTGATASSSQSSPRTDSPRGSEEPAPATSDPDAEGEMAGPAIGSIAIGAEPGSNGGQSVDVDFVAALEDAAAAEIGSLTAEQWFAKREAIVGDEKADVMSWRVDPGGSVAETPVELGEATASFVFAHYSSPGAHRIKVEGEGALTITLGATDFTIDVAQ